MPLRIDLTQARTGVRAPASYVVIEDMTVSLTESKVTLHVRFYFNQAAKTGGLDEVERRDFVVAKRDFPAFRDPILALGYDWLKDQPGFEGAVEV